jgi:DNA-binding protein HU-beta
MNKSELIEAIADKADVPKAQASRVLDAMASVVGDALAEGNQVSMVGFGTFLVRERPARSGRNPRTGETIQIAASKSPSFKAGKALKDRVN